MHQNGSDAINADGEVVEEIAENLDYFSQILNIIIPLGPLSQRVRNWGLMY